MAVAKPMITEVFFFVFCLYTILPKKMSSCKDYLVIRPAYPIFVTGATGGARVIFFCRFKFFQI